MFDQLKENRSKRKVMHINKVISFKNSWETITKEYVTEIQVVLETLDDFFKNAIVTGSSARIFRNRDDWPTALQDKGWKVINSNYYSSSDGQNIYFGGRMPVKNGLSVQVPYGPMDHLSRWLFHRCTLAMKYSLFKLPALLLPMKEFGRYFGDSWISYFSFDRQEQQLAMLAPLSYQYPFLIIGYSERAEVNGPEIIELNADPYVAEPNKIIDRWIEFPPEYHQAGLGILNYFGSYLRERYPDEEAKVRIEQQGLNVRLVIETASGQSEVVEKALHEYELIVTGNESPEKFANSDKLVFELKTELRIAQLRLDTQQDLIGMQNKRIDQLLNIVGEGLSNRTPVTIDFRPTISTTNNIQINSDVSTALGSLRELLESIPPSSNASFVLSELQNSLESIENNTNPDSVRKSPAMSKFKRIIEKIYEGGNELSEAIKKAESGWETFKDLAGKYNKLAEWCGLPQVPSILIS